MVIKTALSFQIVFPIEQQLHLTSFKAHARRGADDANKRQRAARVNDTS